MKLKAIKYSILLALFCVHLVTAQIERIEPPNWWLGMQNDTVQLLVYGKNIAEFTPSILSCQDCVNLLDYYKADNPNYLFLDVFIPETSVMLDFPINFSNAKTEKSFSYNYELKRRIKNPEDYKGFDSSDVIYLITPDRFANGNPENDIVDGLLETDLDRNHNYKRHGGDIQGIINNLDYIDDMGFTAIWSSPLLINDMPEQSYHGYAMTDFYVVDPRFGTLEEYIKLSDGAAQKGIKLIMDQVANHCGLQHWWMKDLPFKDWVNYQLEFEKGEKVINTNHRRTVNQDAYASESDKNLMEKGWFVSAMPDLNQKNPFMAKYLIQNSIWWIETLKLGGIRQDTYPYPDKVFMADWAKAIMTEYPNFNIVGEEWSYNPLLVAYWQADAVNKDGYESYLKSTMDFPLQKALVHALIEDEKWDTGLVKLYEGLANDFAYQHPESILLFGDNHDMDRIYTQLDESLPLTKMTMAFLMVAPRIPQVYYGTEILMKNSLKPGDHGLIRSDFPGGWKTDAVNAFSGEGLTIDQREMQNYLKRLLNFRKEATVIHNGLTKHFSPEKGVYILFRYNESATVMLILNKNDETVELDLSRFKEMRMKGQKFKNVLTGEMAKMKASLSLPSKEALLLVKIKNDE